MITWLGSYHTQVAIFKGLKFCEFIFSWCILYSSKFDENFDEYRKRGKICWAILSRFSWFLSLPWKFFREFLGNEHWWPMHRESVFTKNFIGLKPRMFSPSMSTVLILQIFGRNTLIKSSQYNNIMNSCFDGWSLSFGMHL